MDGAGWMKQDVAIHYEQYNGRVQVARVRNGPGPDADPELTK